MPKKAKKRTAPRLTKSTSAIEREHDDYPAQEREDIYTHGEDEYLEMDLGEREEEIYDETGREKLTEDDEIVGWEEGFAQGYEKKSKSKSKKAKR